jgi:hypothetical protein
LEFLHSLEHYNSFRKAPGGDVTHSVPFTVVSAMTFVAAVILSSRGDRVASRLVLFHIFRPKMDGSRSEFSIHNLFTKQY